jgi:hypothetical protein
VFHPKTLEILERVEKEEWATKSAGYIARKYYISERTVKSYRKEVINGKKNITMKNVL